MPTTAEAVLAQLEATIKAIVPTKRPTQRYQLVTRDDESLRERSTPSGNERDFAVWIGPEWDHGPDAYHNFGEHAMRQEFEVEVGYPHEDNLRELSIRIREDWADIKRALDNEANWEPNVVHQVVLKGRIAQLTRDGAKWVLALTVETQFLEAS